MTLVYRLACALCLAEGVASPDPLTVAMTAGELKDDFLSRGCDLGVPDAIWQLEDGLQMYLESLLPNPLLTIGEGDLEALTPAPLPAEGPCYPRDIVDVLFDICMIIITGALYGWLMGACIKKLWAVSFVAVALGGGRGLWRRNLHRRRGRIWRRRFWCSGGRHCDREVEHLVDAHERVAGDCVPHFQVHDYSTHKTLLS